MNDHQLSSKATKATLGRLELRCPPLPQTLLEATKLIDSPEQLEVGPVTEMVQRDPIVVAKLLHIVNSAYYGLRRTINSVERTVVMLGPVAVAGIVVGMNILKLNSVLDGPAGRCFDRLIQHSIATAFLLRHLLEGLPRQRGVRVSGNRVGVSFTAGLLHDFGKIILVYNYPEEAIALYEKRTIEEQLRVPDVRELEQLVFGCDHTEAGEYVARKLGFPDTLTDVIRLHHSVEEPTGILETDRLVRATAAANLASKGMGYAFDRTVDWKTIASDPVWEQILQHDLRHMGTVEALVSDVQMQKANLDLYVTAMTTRPDANKGKNERHTMKRSPFRL